MKVQTILEKVIEDKQPFFLLEYNSNLFGCEAFSQRIYEVFIFQCLSDGFAELEMDASTFRRFIRENKIPKRSEEGGDIIWAYDDRLRDLWKAWRKKEEKLKKVVYDLEYQRHCLQPRKDEEAKKSLEEVKKEIAKAKQKIKTEKRFFLRKNGIKIYR